MDFSNRGFRNPYFGWEGSLGIARGVRLASEAIAAALAMSIPPLLGFWLDTRAGTLPAFLALGLLLGGAGGWVHFAALLRPGGSPHNPEAVNSQEGHKQDSSGVLR